MAESPYLFYSTPYFVDRTLLVILLNDLLVCFFVRSEEVHQLRHVQSVVGERESSVVNHLAGGMQKGCDSCAAEARTDTDAANSKGSKFLYRQLRRAFDSYKHIDRFGA
jgi:hypothetical protein